MRFILLGLIKTYWLIIPSNRRRCCLFTESCSNYVYRITYDMGLKAGLMALKERYTQCRDGYKIVRNHDGMFIGINLKSGEYLPKDDVSDELARKFTRY
jgi:putative component of membrane protein insertase Oxa1/YidC/SpoIIIJ protein YidD